MIRNILFAVLVAAMAIIGTGSAITPTAHVSGCGSVASIDSLLDVYPDGYTYVSPTAKYISLKKGWLRIDQDGYVTWDGPVQTGTWNTYFQITVMAPGGVLLKPTAKIVMMPCI